MSEPAEPTTGAIVDGLRAEVATATQPVPQSELQDRICRRVVRLQHAIDKNLDRLDQTTVLVRGGVGVLIGQIAGPDAVAVGAVAALLTLIWVVATWPKLPPPPP